MRTLWVVPLAVLTLAACQQSSTVRESMKGNAYRQLEGMYLVLNQEIRVPPGKARVFLQDGAVTAGFDSYRIHCAFEINSVEHDGVAIKPGTFVVSRVQQTVQQVVMAEPLQLASLSLGIGMWSGGSASYYSGYHFWLTSQNQPEVRRMTCFGVFAQPYELYPPTVEEIRYALGTIATLQ